MGRAPFNPNLCCGFPFLLTREYRLPGAEISQNRHITLRGVFRGVVARQRSLMIVYIGDGHLHRFDLESLEAAALEFAVTEESALAQEQEVES